LKSFCFDLKNLSNQAFVVAGNFLRTCEDILGIDIMAATKSKFGFWMLLALVIGNTIGAGIFILPVNLAKIGSISLLSWIFTSAGAILFALIFSRMSQFVTKTGGPYAYAKAGFGNFVGFQVGFTFWISLWTGNSSLVVTLIGYLRTFFPGLSDPLVATAVGIAIIWLIVALNIAGIRPVGVFQIITTIVKLVPILLVIGIGFYFFHPHNITHHFNLSGQSNLSAFSFAAMLTLWAFVGMEAACVPVGVTENARRNVHLATLIGVIVIALVYIAVSIAVMGMFPSETLIHMTSPFATAVGMIFGKWGQMFVVVCVVISCLGALNSGLFLEGQIPMAIADDGLFPKIFAKRNRAGVPAWALIIDALLMSGFIMLTSRPNLADQFQLVVTIASVATLIAYLYSAMAEVIFLAKGGKVAYKKVGVVMAILAAIYAMWAILGSGKEIVFYMTMLLFTSVLLYSLLYWKKSTVSGDAEESIEAN
jgi:basic amino acid/polyamine antiporter, APA family